jgi:hypothetical protein
MIIARRFNAGSEAGFDIVPKGRLNGAPVLRQFFFHGVFGTKERRRLITPALRKRLWPFPGCIARQYKIKAHVA